MSHKHLHNINENKYYQVINIYLIQEIKLKSILRIE